MKTRQIDSDNMEDSLESNPLEESDDFFEDVDDTSDLPMSLIVTNVDISVYTDSEQRASSPEGEGKDGAHLQPPLPQRQFLISPPASPPVGWAPSEEAQPCISYDIISALASLTPGETHELHPATGSQPGIVVHVCEETSPSKGKPKVLHTRRPDHPGNGNDSPPSAAAES
ncbi:calcipressin, putative [Ixodes scapularis]|uniref:Calcipressin, putative n=1 Tax=Ixodes scapularis TaxID=6945 RepID=B7PNS1_IXOSC|nr:calcipressin, putative [Ixodes scapularis]|eukprot:XP_002435413.1 calcipressin, putative [Ixodes scapularis]